MDWEMNTMRTRPLRTVSECVCIITTWQLMDYLNLLANFVDCVIAIGDTGKTRWVEPATPEIWFGQFEEGWDASKVNSLIVQKFNLL